MKWKFFMLILLLLAGGFVYLGMTEPKIAPKPVETALDAGKILQ